MFHDWNEVYVETDQSGASYQILGSSIGWQVIECRSAQCRVRGNSGAEYAQCVNYHKVEEYGAHAPLDASVGSEGVFARRPQLSLFMDRSGQAPGFLSQNNFFALNCVLKHSALSIGNNKCFCSDTLLKTEEGLWR